MTQRSNLPSGVAPPTTQPSASTLGERLQVGQTLDQRYRIVRQLGSGGMAAVYLARHAVIGKPVAVKVLDSRLVTEAQGSQRLFREAQAAAAIGHPSIIDVLDVGVTPAGDPYLVMEYLEGEDLSSWMRRHQTLSVAAACGICEQVLQPLRAAHAKGIVHRDLKPANIFVVRREGAMPTVKLIDFGISKVVGASDLAKITQTGAMLGTPAYMSPEQARGEEDVDARADLYAVGVMFYQLVTGKLPFRGSNYNDLLYKIINDEPTLPESAVADLPDDVGALIRRALAKEPDERHQSVDEMLAAFEALEVWPERVGEIEKLCASVECVKVEGVDVATQVSPVSPIGVRVIAPDGTADSQLPSTRVEAPGPARAARTRVSWLVGIAAAALLVAVLALVIRPGSEPATAPPLPPGVLITLRGAPAGARVLYDGAPVRENPFRVRPAQTIVPLRVEQPGYQPFVTTVVPARDLEVRVALVPLATAAAEPSSSAAAPAASASAAASPRKRLRRAPKSSEIGRSGRDTLYSDKFE